MVFPFFGLYGATKFAVEALTESYHLELSQLGVDVVLVQPSNYPTSVFSSAILPSDAKTIEGYGAIGGIPNKMVQTLLESFEGETAPNPHDVAEAIAKLVTEAKGTRSMRTVVGQSFGTDAINHGAAEVQVQLLAALGLGFLAGISAVPENA